MDIEELNSKKQDLESQIEDVSGELHSLHEELSEVLDQIDDYWRVKGTTFIANKMKEVGQ